MKKTLQKGFSLVELLVVVAIIGVLAGVGIVGYQSYTDSAKSRVALANFNSVKRFVDTELTLLNNNIQTVSGALSEGASCSDLTKYTIHSGNMSKFLTGLACYFDTGGDGYGNAFKNPYDAAGGNQIFFNATAGDQTKGAINFKLPTSDQVVGGTTATENVSNASTKGMFYIEYFTASASTGSGDYKSAMYELK